MSELPPDLESLLVEQVVDRKRTHRKTAIGLPAIFLPLALISSLALDPPEQNLWLLCVVAGLLGMLFFIPALGNPRDAKPLRLLRERAQDIVWTYAFVVRNRATSWLLLRMADGKSVRLPAKFGSENAVLDALAPYLPHATFGFTPEREAQYRRDPSSLRRSVGA
jgi:hypothetical protein